MVSHTRYGTCRVFHVDAHSAFRTCHQFSTGDRGAGDMAHPRVALHVCYPYGRLDGWAYDHPGSRYISPVFACKSVLATQPTDQSVYCRPWGTRLLRHAHAALEFLA